MTATHYHKIDDEQPALPGPPTQDHKTDDGQSDLPVPPIQDHKTDDEQPGFPFPPTTTGYHQINDEQPDPPVSTTHRLLTIRIFLLLAFKNPFMIQIINGLIRFIIEAAILAHHPRDFFCSDETLAIFAKDNTIFLRSEIFAFLLHIVFRLVMFKIYDPHVDEIDLSVG